MIEYETIDESAVRFAACPSITWHHSLRRWLTATGLDRSWGAAEWRRSMSPRI